MTPEERRAQFDRVPREMREAERWLVWRLVENKKPPIGEDGRALPDWKSALLTFDIALGRLVYPGAGLGFVHGEGWGGIDLDACRDPKTGIVDPRAASVIEKAAAYAE